jgi:hypothetical protein
MAGKRHEMSGSGNVSWNLIIVAGIVATVVGGGYLFKDTLKSGIETVIVKPLNWAEKWRRVAAGREERVDPSIPPDDVRCAQLQQVLRPM